MREGHTQCEEKQGPALLRIKQKGLKMVMLWKFSIPYKVQVYNYVVVPT